MNRIALLAFIFFLSFQAIGKELIGRVVKVVDGDTVHVLDARRQMFKVRLEGIDAPEMHQDYGLQSKRELDKLLRVIDYAVVVEYAKTDRYGRLLGTIYPYPKPAQLLSINSIMVSSGYAWAYRKYSVEYVSLEDFAKQSHFGLWGMADPIPPWEFRRQNRAKK